MLQPVILEGRVVRLEPLALGHVPGLCLVGLDPELSRWTPRRVTNASEMRAYVEKALAGQAQGNALPFAVVHLPSGAVIGSTRYAAFSPEHRRIEIGWTWYSSAHQRTAVNTEAKYLLLMHAFETLGIERVELKTDALNEASRRAILRIGAKEEGVLRHHMVMPEGRLRDTVYYSILAAEWPTVKARLEGFLRRQGGGATY